jgi:hypothetical protein
MARRQSQQTGIFNRADYETLVRVERDLNEMLPLLDKADSCGVDCAVFRQQRDDLAKQLSLIKQHFMTPPPG